MLLLSLTTNNLKKKREYIRKARAKKESGQEREGFPVTTFKLSKLAKYLSLLKTHISTTTARYLIGQVQD